MPTDVGPSPTVWRFDDMTMPEIPGFDELTQIGRGGFSRVYRARQTKLGREVAIKVLNFGLTDAGDKASFERETRLMGRVSAHPNIVTIHDTAFTTNGQPCIVMELHPGGSIAQLVDSAGPLAPNEAVDVGIAIASALESSHSAGVLHCDLKPQNILISSFGQAALGDFGISTFTEERTRTGSGGGFTLHYAAPEVVEGASPTPRSDVYSLAATLYTVLAGRRPFSSEEKQSSGDLARRVLLEQPEPLTMFGVPGALSAAIGAAMAKEPTERPAGAGDFAQRLHEVGVELGYATSPPSIVARNPLPTLRVHEPRSGDAETATGPAPLVAPPPAPARPGGTASPRASTPARPSASASPPVLADPASPADGNDPAGPEQLDDRDHTVHRHDGVRPPEPVPEPELDRRGPSLRRRLIAAAVGLAAVAAIAGLLLFTDGADDPAPEREIVAAQPVGDPLAAPSTPTNVSMERVGASAVRVWWDSPDDDAVFEVRRSDVDTAPVTSSINEAVLQPVAASETPCVTVLALRASRAAAPTDPVCLAVEGQTVEVRPAECRRGDCTVRLVLSDYPANSRVSIGVLDPDGLDIRGYGASYEGTVETDDDGRVDSWRLELPELLPAGRYLVLVEDDVGEGSSGVLTVLDPDG